MFRRPMRLEKWIAFDGALGVEVLDAARHSDENEGGTDTSDSGSDVHETAAAHNEQTRDDAFAAVRADLGVMPMAQIGFEVDGYKINLDLPDAFLIDNADAVDWIFPFTNTSDTPYFRSGESSWYLGGSNFFFDVSKPNGGSFTLLDFSLAGASVEDQNAFILKNRLDELYNNTSFNQTWIAFDSGQTDTAANTIVNFQRIVKSGDLYYFTTKNQDVPSAVIQYTDGGFRFVVTDFGYTWHGNHVVQAILHSAVFEPDDKLNQYMFEGYGVDIYYQPKYDYEAAPELFGDGENGIFRDDNAPVGSVVVGTPDVPPELPGPEDPDNPDNPDDPGPDDPDPTFPEFPSPEDPEPEPIDPGPDVPEPEPDDPGPIVSIPDPFVPPPADFSSEAFGEGDAGEGFDLGGMGDMDMNGDRGDGEWLRPDELVYIFHDDGDFLEIEDVEVTEEAQELPVEAVPIDSHDSDTFAGAMMEELTRDFGDWLDTVDEDRNLLSLALARLGEEYLVRERGDWEGLRETLRTFFDTGNGELAAADRIAGQMRRQMEEFNAYPPERQDGLLVASLRELVEGAERRSGLTSALAIALDAVSANLKDARLDGASPPATDELEDLFREQYDKALESWRHRAERSDPMGRELEHFGRNRTS